jgi:NAD(P)-dependent dehydrogenase (short-subunit alcohol dehydrogenase family)/phosphopantetheinyl transferase/acyl-CoA thioesterase FadM/acyl carrier protein/3-hydroxymyristoyl/3-hydroxydecanoyl-(acyl carrier protein) dehydratase
MNNSKNRSDRPPNEALVKILSQYFQKRGSFLARVIYSDFKSLNDLDLLEPSYQKTLTYPNDDDLADSNLINNNLNGDQLNGLNGLNGNRNVQKNGHYGFISANQNGAHKTNDSSVSQIIEENVNYKSEVVAISKPDIEIESILLDLVVQQTGYPPESIDLNLRLLDDLNLDSIKAGELIADAAKQVGVAGEIDPSTFANSTLQEIADGIREVLPVSSGTVSQTRMEVNVLTTEFTEVNLVTTSTPAKPQLDISELLLNLIQEQTGFPKDSLTMDLRLLDDLNLDSIKAAELIATAAKQIGLQGELDPSSLANATLEDIVQALKAATPTQITSAAKTKTQAKATSIPNSRSVESSWVRNFAIEYIPQDLPSNQPQDLTDSKVLIVTDSLDNSIAQNLKEQLIDRTATVELTTYQEILTTGQQNYSHYIAILPSSSTQESLPLEAMVGRLKSIACPPKNTCIAYVEFGGGYFGSNSDEIQPEVCCAASFARSVHLERPDLRVRVVDFEPTIEAKIAAELVIKELSSRETIVTAGYNHQLTRLVPQSRLKQPIEYQARSYSWSDRDVILVTGGAKGITAECALALAVKTGAKMALIGRSPAPSNGRGEIANVLARFADRKLTALYYSCDIGDLEAVIDLVEAIERDLGAITGVIHGAGLNTPRRVEQVSLETAQQEASPKLLGAENLLTALAKQPPKLFAAFSSIIGVTGMAGNSWYAFANESLALMLNRFNSQHPETEVISLAYSVWSEVGMGARMGSVKNLARMGIDAIPPTEGIDSFLKLWLGDPGVQQVVIAARLGGLDTWYPVQLPIPEELRFVEKIEYVEPGVEVKARAHLSLERDLYVGDHIWRGSYLFPTVFGLEAMAQATAYLMGTIEPEIIRIESISLRRPVVVNPENGTEIEVHAQAMETDLNGETKVEVTVASEQNNFIAPSFKATLVLGKRETTTSKAELKIGQPLDIEPKRDLYGGLLFQGKLFQQLDRLYSLSREYSILESHVLPAAELAEVGFAPQQGSHLILGDPYFRDILLQSMQVNIPQDICLPVEIDRIDIYRDPVLASGARFIQAILHEKDGKEYICEVIASDLEGNIVERLTNYKLRILEEHPENPTAVELAFPETRDEKLLTDILQQTARELKLSIPQVNLGHKPQLGSKSKTVRRQEERPIVARALQRHLDLEEVDFKLKTLASGKPQFIGKNLTDIDLSLSHDETYCLCAVGQEAQGCDIEIVEHRSQQDWMALLGAKQIPLLEELLQKGDNLDLAGTRIWSATEAVRKAFNGTNPDFSVIEFKESGALLKAETEAGTHFVLTLSLELTRKPKRIIALIVQRQKVARKVDLASATLEEMVETIIQPHHHLVDITDNGPQGQRVYVERFQVSFRQACSVSRQVPVSQYISWVGKFREAPMISMAEPMLRDFYSGKYGIVTNDVTLKILGDATTYDTIEGRCWMGNVKDSSFDTYIEFCKVLPDHSLERVAMAEVKATWVRLLKYGIPAPDPLPDYLANYIKHFAVDQPASIDLKNDPTVTLPKLPESLANLDPGKVIYQAPLTPKRDDLIFWKVYQTTLEETNAVGNVYYGNYFIWQARTIDMFFYKYIPEYFRVEQSQGEVLPLYSRMTYLKEAMPFDKVRANLYVDRVTECGAVFYFEFLRETEDGSLEKLHRGEQEVVWAVRDRHGRAIPTPWPQEVLHPLLKYSKKLPLSASALLN